MVPGYRDDGYARPKRGRRIFTSHGDRIANAGFWLVVAGTQISPNAAGTAQSSPTMEVGPFPTSVWNRHDATVLDI